MQTIQTILIFTSLHCVKIEQKQTDGHKESLASFRLKMEELPEDRQHKIIKDESSEKFVSFLIDNVKELFPNTDNLTRLTEITDEAMDSDLLIDAFRKTTKLFSYTESKKSFNNSITDLFSIKFLQPESGYVKLNNSNRTAVQLLNFKDDIDSETNKQLENYALQSIKYSVINVSKLTRDYSYGRSCIACDNVMNKDCSDPKFKLIPSILCKRDDDLCYSQHTPFGIIDRGCFNINHNLTVFVCACNLCNYISISEMPYIFSNKRDWIENVIELSRAKRFRESIFKDMSCLRCEVNVTAKTGDMAADAYCLEGNIDKLPHQVCASDEICAVKAVRSTGYMWRGCVSEPLYNYWWTLCDSDLCNYDNIVSVYDNN